MSPFYLIGMDTCHNANTRELCEHVIFCLPQKVVAQRSLKGEFSSRNAVAVVTVNAMHHANRCSLTRIDEKLCTLFCTAVLRPS
jgi:hypothetical protein